jgi:hypothetical protein
VKKTRKLQKQVEELRQEFLMEKKRTKYWRNFKSYVEVSIAYLEYKLRNLKN